MKNAQYLVNMTGVFVHHVGFVSLTTYGCLSYNHGYNLVINSLIETKL